MKIAPSVAVTAMLLTSACGDSPSNDATAFDQQDRTEEGMESARAESDAFTTRVGFMGENAAGEKVLYISQEIQLTMEEMQSLMPALEDHVRREHAGGDEAQLIEWRLAGDIGEDAMQGIVEDNRSRGRETVMLDVPVDDLLDRS